jgi:hypothetical protein
MAWHLYRRHRRDCLAGRPYDSRSGESDEHRKGWKRCGCRIYVSGTLAGDFARQNAHKTSWDDARAFVATLDTPPRSAENGAKSSVLTSRRAAAGGRCGAGGIRAGTRHARPRNRILPRHEGSRRRLPHVPEAPHVRQTPPHLCRAQGVCVLGPVPPRGPRSVLRPHSARTAIEGQVSRVAARIFQYGRIGIGCRSLP